MQCRDVGKLSEQPGKLLSRDRPIGKYGYGHMNYVASELAPDLESWLS